MINSLSDLKKLLQLCRKQGVTDIEVAGVKLKFGDMPMQPHGQEVDQEDQYSQEELDELTGLPKMAFFSAPGENQ